jgi:hypothetical protein
MPRKGLHINNAERVFAPKGLNKTARGKRERHPGYGEQYQIPNPEGVKQK